jgi:LPLT family lysophospholipid transporter-like MFS transporter
LLSANGKLEGLTIVAILGGTVAGGFIAGGMPLALQLLVCVALYLASVTIALSIPDGPRDLRLSYWKSALSFTSDFAALMKDPVTRFSMIGTSAFWMTAVLLRIAFLGWLTVNLPNLPKDQQPTIVGMTAIGIVVGSLLASRLFEVRTFYKSLYVGLALVGAIVIAVFSPNLYVLIPMLLAIGAFGGLFVVPMNAALQEVGTPMVGSGKVIAIQNFFENILMFGAMGLLYAHSKDYLDTSINTVILIGAGLLLVIIVYLFTQRHTVRGLFDSGNIHIAHEAKQKQQPTND